MYFAIGRKLVIGFFAKLHPNLDQRLRMQRNGPVPEENDKDEIICLNSALLTFCRVKIQQIGELIMYMYMHNPTKMGDRYFETGVWNLQTIRV